MKRMWLLALLLAGCASESDPARPSSTSPSRVKDGVSYTADVAIMESFPVQLRPSVSLANGNSAPVNVAFPDGCVVLLKAYRSAARSGVAAYDQSRISVCTMAIVEAGLAPGARRSFDGSTVSAAEILGDSLPNGLYHLSVLVRPFGQPLELPAGSVDLAQ